MYNEYKDKLVKEGYGDGVRGRGIRDASMLKADLDWDTITTEHYGWYMEGYHEGACSRNGSNRDGAE